MQMANNLIYRVGHVFSSGLIRVFLFLSILLSLGFFLVYKVKGKELKNEKNKHYKTVLLYRILMKTMIPIPIVCWVVFVITIECLNFKFDSYFNSDWFGYSFLLIWIIWCTTIWISRKIYRKIRKNKLHKPPTPFYK